MKYRLCLILFFVIAFGYKNFFSKEELSESLYLDKQSIGNSYSFWENGAKCTYEINENAENELSRIKSIITNKKNCTYIVDNIKNLIEIKKENEIIYICLYDSKIKGSCKVEMEIKNYDKQNNIDALIRKLIELKNDNGNSIRYFTYLKVKVNNIEEGLALVKNNSNFKNIQILSINSGYTGIAQYKNKRINFSINNYNDNSYLVIGTPIIFISY